VGVITNDRDVNGAFTKGGWAFMQGAFRKIDQYYGGEEWVLGTYKSADMGDRAKLEAMLRDRYTADFIGAWRNYFRNSTVLPYANLKDAAQKLNKQSGIQSPILQLFWLASLNTDVDSPKVKDAFQPVHFVAPPVPDRISASSNQPYLTSLTSLQVSIDQAANAPNGIPDQAMASSTLSQASNAKVSVKQVAQNFRIEPDAHIEARVQDLMEKPITYAEGLLRGLGPKEMNAKGAGFCSMFNMYPLAPGARNDATPQDIVRLLKPGEGELWKFYEANLKQIISRQGNQFVANPAGGMSVNPAFLSFLNTMSKASDAFFRSGGDPKMPLTLTPTKAEGIQNLVFNISGQLWNIPQQGGPGKQFVVPGPSPAIVSINGTQYGSPIPGIWAVLRLLDAANRFDPAGAGYHLTYYFKTAGEFGKVGGTAAQGAPAEFNLDLGGVPAFFRNGPNCTSVIAR
jgi:type VI secretion system protein ImpL